MGWQGVAEGVWGEILSLFRLLTSPQPKSTRTALFSKKPKRGGSTLALIVSTISRNLQGWE